MMIEKGTFITVIKEKREISSDIAMVGTEI